MGSDLAPANVKHHINTHADTVCNAHVSRHWSYVSKVWTETSMLMWISVWWFMPVDTRSIKPLCVVQVSGNVNDTNMSNNIQRLTKQKLAETTTQKKNLVFRGRRWWCIESVFRIV